jgi:hypothetical protein
MLTTIKGIYDHGQIVLTEQPPIKTKADVIVTFLQEEEVATKPLGKNQIRLGGLEGKMTIPADFNEPLDELKDYM